MTDIPRPMSKSPNDIARHALAVARDTLDAYSDKHSPKLYTQHQLFAICVLRQFFRTDLRGIVAILRDSSDLRRILGLKRVPHYSTLSYAEQRLFKGGVYASASNCGPTREDERATSSSV
jgi:hypothetical protein